MKTDRENTVIRREMLFDLYYRLQLADEKFCQAGEKWLTASTVGDGRDRFNAVAALRALARALRILARDWQFVTDSKDVIFPAELDDCFLESPRADEEVQIYLERLHAITKRMDYEVQKQLEQLEMQERMNAEAENE